MSRDYRLYLADIVESCDKIRDYVGSLTFEEFSEDAKTIDAVARNLEIIGEAVKNVPAAILSEEPTIDWANIARFRDVIVHQYFRIKLTVVWDIVQTQIDPLRKAAAKIMNSLPEPEA